MQTSTVTMAVHASNRNAELLDAYRAQFGQPLGKAFDIVVQRGHGSYLWDSDGERFLDFTSGMSGNIIGHCHPVVVAEVKKQVDQLIHTGGTAFHKPAMELVAKLLEIAPNDLDGVQLYASWNEALRAACEFAAINGGLRISDTRLTSPGRCGTWFVTDDSSDVVLFNNSIASGFPISGFFARRSALESWAAEQDATTYGDSHNPVACAASLTTLRVIQQDGLIESAQKLSDKLESGLAALPNVTTVRGLYAEVEFENEAAARVVVERCFSQNLLLIESRNCVRLMPPLNCSMADLDKALSTFAESLTASH